MITRALAIHWLSRLHRVLGLVPFAWLLAMTVFVCRVTWQLGHLPGYQDPTPEAWVGVHLMVMVLFGLGIYAILAWSICTAMLLTLAPRELRSNIVSVGLCLLSIGAYAAVLWLPNLDLIEWLFD